MKLCPVGQTYRKSYTRRTGRKGTGRKGTGLMRIAGQCVRSQTRYASPLKQDRTSFRGFRKSKRALRACPSGFIKRAAYVRYTKKGKHSLVPEQCIRDVGAPGKGLRGGPGIGPLRKGDLAKFGYINVITMPVDTRHKALTKAIEVYGSLSVWRKLNAVAIYTRRISPGASAVFKSDMDWIRSKFGIKAF
jgi:hypothetical protein